MKTLGIIGGLGPMATGYLMELITKMTDAKCDSGHIRMIIFSRPDIPDRTDFILGKSEDDPRPLIVETGRMLIGNGADVLAMPCITAHFFHQYISERLDRPIINMVDETAAYLKACGYSKVGVMATDGTIRTGLFKEGIEGHGMECVIPDDGCQRMVMGLIYDDIKANRPPRMPLFEAVSSNLRQKGAQVIVLGCTELSLIKQAHKLGKGYLDALDVLSRRAVIAVGAPLKKEYDALVTA